MELPQAPAANPALALRNRYVLALSLIALLIISSQVLIQLTIIQNDDDSRVINIAGRQRMLSQKISKTTLEIIAAPDQASRENPRQELGDALRVWRQSHDGLLHGDADLGVNGNNSSQVLELFGEIEGDFQIMAAAAASLETASALSSATREDLSTLSKPILDREAAFLKGMNAITFQYDLETKNRLDNIRTLEYVLLIITFLTLGLEAMFIFLPAERQISQFFRDMKQAVVILQEQASHDAMTGLYNKSTGLLLLQHELERAQRNQTGLTLIFIDLDGLKSVNDRRGHETGDLYITRFAELIKSRIRTMDVAMRYGGDEFIIIVGDNAAAGRALLRRLDEAVLTHNQQHDDLPLAWSAGLAECRECPDCSPDDLIRLADSRMYEEKARHHIPRP